MKRNNLKILLLLHLLMMVYSVSGIFSKLASGEEFLSFRFIFFYACVIGILGIYAIGWQQIIKHMPLTAAYANKAVCTIWGSVWGILFFNETISLGKVLGIILIIIGIILFTTDEVPDNE